MILQVTAVWADIFKQNVGGSEGRSTCPCLLFVATLVALNLHKDWGLTLFTGQSQVTQWLVSAGTRGLVIFCVDIIQTI